MERISIRVVSVPDKKSAEQLIKWFCLAFGLETGNSADAGVEEELLKKFIEAAYKDRGISSSEIKLRNHIARSTIIYHLNRLMDAGLLVKKGRKYYLRATDMYRSIEEIEYDLDREMSRMLDTAREFDRIMATKLKKLK
jgi:predicted transcriptional regulator